MNPSLVLLGLRLLLAALLVTILALLLYYLWRDTQAALVQKAGAPAAHLFEVEGPAAGKVYPLVDVNQLGRAADNPLRFDDSAVSAYHARISYRGGQWWLEDLGSRNGTFLNGLRVDEPLVLTYGDEIVLGAVRLRLQAGPAILQDCALKNSAAEQEPGPSAHLADDAL